ncbi:MAG TPA: glutamate-cysteine ligase family protein [Acidimicrobiales bacterium]|nr:glutamate-cysteine ligase family protein [Acidimicrobiales bacterium]
MPVPRRNLVASDVETYVRERCFAPAQDGQVGIELERHLVSSDRAAAGVDHHAVHGAVDALDPLPGGSRVTFEPGGQLEVSSPPRPGPSAACAVLTADLAVVDPVVEGLGIELAAVGLHPDGHEELVVRGPRYDAMAAYLDHGGPCGRTMMCSTAALQVNLDIGDDAVQPSRWRLAHQLGPVLLAAFANSPIGVGKHKGWRSGRAAAWAGIDASRTLPATEGPEDPATAWLRYALDARVMLIRCSEARYEPILSPLTFAQWLEVGHELGFPTLEDFAYHLGTLFPPVRGRGWLELRMVDALPHPWWTAAASVCAALLDDPEAADEADRVTRPTAGLWSEAAQHGPAHPQLATAARSCFAAAVEALPRMEADAATIDAVVTFGERFVERGRCPADEVLDPTGPARTDRPLEVSRR